MQSRKWIFLRGLGRHSMHWGPIADIFQATFPQDEIEFLELRGNGTLAHSPSCLTIRDNVRDLRSRSRFLKKGEPVYLMTISLGSMIGVEWALLHPEEVKGLVTINTSDSGTSSLLERMRPQNYLDILRTLALSPDNQDIEAIILQKYASQPEKQRELKEKFAKIPNTTRWNYIRQLKAAAAYQFPQQKPRTEILLLCSDGDQFVNSICSKRIAEQWTLKAHVHPTADHDIPMEDPNWVCQEIQNWLQNFSK